MRNHRMIVIALVVGLGVGYTIAGGISAPGNTAKAADTLSQDDRQAILDLISSYSHTYDSKDADGFIALFAEDGVMVSNSSGARAPTRQELLAGVKDRFASFREDGIQSRHYQTNTVLDPLADGSVSGETIMAVAWQRRDEPAPVLAHTGTYGDLFVKTDSGWKFKRRELRVDHD